MDRSNPSHPSENSFQNWPRTPRLVRRAAGVMSVLFLLTLLLGSSVPAGTAPTPVPSPGDPTCGMPALTDTIPFFPTESKARGEAAVPQDTGLHPTNADGFETGDWRNFRPHYVGESDDWIRPRFHVTAEAPIEGDYSLRWTGGEDAHEWLMLSNAFYLRSPVELSADVRVQADTDDWAVGLLLLESHERAAGLRATAERTILDEGPAAPSTTEAPTGLSSDAVYRLTVHLSADQQLRVQVSDPNTGETLVERTGRTAVQPEALGLFVHTEANSSTTIDFDAVSVEAAPYRVPSGEWTRSPQFVVLPRAPELAQEQGNWVGGHSTMKRDGRYLMWYRIRSNEERGAGYGLAESEDGLHWQKSSQNPIFTHAPEYNSNEKISVLHVDGQYQAWYAVDVADGPWHTAYATSEDGVHWQQHGVVIEEGYNKDSAVLYHDGTYYLYAIAGEGESVGIYTSSNGRDWERRRTIPMGVHRHMAAVYVEAPGEFHLYLSGGHVGVSRAVSSNGLDFGPFKQIMRPSPVGLDDWHRAGVTYLSFLTNEHGHVPDARTLPVYYQARNTFDNNIPGWHYHGSERVVLGGRFEGLYPGIPTDVRPDGQYAYHRFPFEQPRARGLEVRASRPITLTLEEWDRNQTTLGTGQLETPSSTVRGRTVQTQVRWHLEGLAASQTYELHYNGEAVATGTADEGGELLWTTLAPEADTQFEIRRHP